MGHLVISRWRFSVSKDTVLEANLHNAGNCIATLEYHRNSPEEQQARAIF